MTLTLETRRQSYRKVKAEGKLTKQKDIVLNVLRGRVSPMTAHEIDTALQIAGTPMLLTSIRRTLTGLCNDDKKIIAVDSIKEKYGSKNVRYKIKETQGGLW